MYLLGQRIGDQCGEGREERCQEYAHISYIDGYVQHPHQPIQGRRGEHQAGVDGAADDAAQRIPGAIIEPIVKLVEALLGKEPRGAVIKVRIELMDDAFEAQHGK